MNRKRNQPKRNLIWRRTSFQAPQANSFESNVAPAAAALQNTTYSVGTHPLVNDAQNRLLRDYEMKTKAGFDTIEQVLKDILSQQHQANFERWANNELFSKLGVTLEDNAWELNANINSQRYFQVLFSKIVFAQFMRMSEDFFVNDPLNGQSADDAQKMFEDCGIHALGVSPCSDGRLAHFISYVLRLPYSLARRKAHAGALFDISESVRNWVFVEHSRFREAKPNSAEAPTRYLKMAVYHYSKEDPSHQGCAAHGSDDHKAGSAALERLNDFRQAIENRFGCGSTIDTLLLGVNTDDDSMRIHIPDSLGVVALDRYVETDNLYDATLKLNADEAKKKILATIVDCNINHRLTPPQLGLQNLLVWLIGKNFSQIEYVRNYEQGCYNDLGHAERFVGIGSGFEEVQLRNLSYYSFLDTIEEGENDIDVGIKIFKGLNVKRGLPIPIIIRCDYDGRVPGSKDRARKKAQRLEKSVHNRYHDLSHCGLLKTMATLRDYTGHHPVEKLN